MPQNFHAAGNRRRSIYGWLLAAMLLCSCVTWSNQTQQEELKSIEVLSSSNTRYPDGVPNAWVRFLTDAHVYYARPVGPVPLGKELESGRSLIAHGKKPALVVRTVHTLWAHYPWEHGVETWAPVTTLIFYADADERGNGAQSVVLFSTNSKLMENPEYNFSTATVEKRFEIRVPPAD